MATKQLDIKQYASAINLYGYIGQYDRIKEISSLILSDYLNSGEPKNLFCIQSINKSVVSRVGILKSLAIYLDIISLMIEDSTEELWVPIISFFKSSPEPNQVWPVLLVDLISLLNNGDFIGACSSENLYQLLASCQLLIDSSSKELMYMPMINSTGHSIVSKFKSVKDVDDSIQLLIYSCLKAISVF
ncbi:hypothetical protein AYI68_g3385 [Smittium mucronatum]|uniref:Nuclear pore complex protein Nup85 n=1 Tax=Smittium mucronatum TaxID=133383 RepID=A0A1R0H024_9FUNG|nr:hypothetical protein AYI68_g3385 [Smittium mucronatum]